MNCRRVLLARREDSNPQPPDPCQVLYPIELPAQLCDPCVLHEGRMFRDLNLTVNNNVPDRPSIADETGLISGSGRG